MISVRFAHQETFPARRGTGPPRVSPQRGRKYTPSRKRGASLSRHSSSINRARQTRPFTNRVSFLPHFAANIRRAPKPSFPRLFQPFCARKRPSLRPSRRLIPRHPAGRTAGSARTRSRVQTLENPFVGSRPHLPVSHPPKPPQADGPCTWAVRRVCALPPEQKRNEAPKPPARGAWAREYGANGTGRRHCRPAG